MRAVRLRISGLVHGVGFRAFVLREARALALKGWVRNRADATVEALATGTPEALETFVARCREGPYAARVRDVQVSAEESEALFDFRQRPTL